MNYHATFRTNYFRVTDEDKLRDIVSRLHCDNSAKLFEEKNGVFGFGGDGSLSGLTPPEGNENDEPSIDQLVCELQEILPEDEAVIIMEAGHEGLRYVVGSVMVITRDNYDYAEIKDVGIKLAQEILKNPEWDTICEY